jgi:peptide deformylase
MIREIVTYPNPLLKEKSRNILRFDEKLHTLLDDMYDTMDSREGVGLAAIQIGITYNVLIICPPNDNGEVLKENLIEAINPKIIEMDGEQTTLEGCLSVPDFFEDIKRAKTIKVEFFDRFGKKHINSYSDFLAVAWQHEMDHLNGNIFIEKLSIIKRKKFEKELKKRQKRTKK